MRFNQIQHWLDELNREQLSPAAPATANDDRAVSDRADSDGTASYHVVKRRRLNDPITPPSSETPPDHCDGQMDSPVRGGGSSKRFLDDETPRAKRKHTGRLQRSHPSLSSTSSDHSPSSSHRSGRTASPQKQLRLLELNPQGLEVRDMYDVTGTNRPPGLATLLRDIEAFSDGQGIVARDSQHALQQAAGSDARFDWALREGAPHVSDNPSLEGRTPSPAAVCQVMRATYECKAKKHPEANWNLKVHQRILDMAFYPTADSEFENLIQFMGSATASIIPAYGVPTVSKKVDFCVYIEPKNDPLLSPTFLTRAGYARTVLPKGIVNFTDFAPLYDRFIALSIETKKPSENFEAAQLQLGVWDMAHWSFLRQLVELQPAITDAATDDIRPTKLPTFLPGIIIQGEYWYLIITTMEGEKTVLWENVVIGTTSKPRGVYQIIRTLQYLENWARDVHWPWLRTMVEGLSVANA